MTYRRSYWCQRCWRWWRCWRVTCPHAGRQKSIRWSRCGTNEALPIANCQLPIFGPSALSNWQLEIGNWQWKLEIDYGFTNQRHSLCGEGPGKEAGVCGDRGDYAG